MRAAGHRGPPRARPGALASPGGRAARPGALPEMRQTPARAGAQPVRAVRRETAVRRPRAPSPAHRRARRRWQMPPVRRPPARRRAFDLRYLRREDQPGEPRPRCPAARGGNSAPRSRKGARVRARAVPPRARRAPGRRSLHRLRHGAGGPGPGALRALPGEAEGRFILHLYYSGRGRARGSAVVA